MKYFEKIIKISLCLALGIIVSAASGCAKYKITTDTTGEISVPENSADNTAKPATDQKNPLVTIQFKGFGSVNIELYPSVAPNTVNNFISLINKGFYNGLTIHRIVPGFVIQGGDPKGDGTGDPGYYIKGEFKANGFDNPLKHSRGVISMARLSQPMDSAGSQFFIVLQNNDSLNEQYAAFGKVTEGMDVVDKIAEVERGAQGMPKNPPIMEKVTVETFGIHYPEPETIKK